METHEGRNFYVSILHYLFYASNLEDNYIIDSLKEISTTGGEIAMSTAEKLIQKGIQKGRQEGIQEGKQEGIQKGKIETAQKMIKQGFQDSTIESITGLTQNEIQKLRRE